MTNPLVTAIPSTGNNPALTTRLNLSLSMALPLEDAAAVTAFNTWNLATDNTLFPSLIYAGSIYEYDAGDSTTAHDPAAGCITDVSGRRYKRSLNIKPDHNLLDKDLAVPPVSPAQQAAYFVATAATGAWAGHDDEVAIYGRQGWHFRTVDEGHILYVSDEAVYYHMPASGTLVKGLGDLALGNASIKPKHLQKPMGLMVEAEQDTPPVSMPGDGVAYIVGSAPTGAWAGKAGDVAISNGTSWDFLTAVEGAQVWNKGLGYNVAYLSGSWVRATVSPIILASPAMLIMPADLTSGTLLTWSSIQYPVGTRIRIEFFAKVLNTNSPDAYETFQADLFVDSEVTERQSGLSYKVYVGTGLSGFYSCIFEIDVPDASSHDYHIKGTGSGDKWAAGSRAILTVLTAA